MRRGNFIGKVEHFEIRELHRPLIDDQVLYLVYNLHNDKMVYANVDLQKATAWIRNKYK